MYAKVLEKKRFRTDEWLKRNWQSILTEDDKFNSPEGFYVADLINRRWKYVIECDGFSHDSKGAQKKDLKRDQWFSRSGYSVFRVRFGDYATMDLIKEKVRSIRGESIKTVLRKK